MAEITTAGYQLLRDFIESGTGYAYIELQTASGVTWERLQISADARCVWTHAPSAQTLELTITISGDDADVTLPEEFGKSVFFAEAEGGSALSTETFTTATLEHEDDELVIKHRIEVPQVVQEVQLNEQTDR